MKFYKDLLLFVLLCVIAFVLAIATSIIVYSSIAFIFVSILRGFGVV